MDKELWEQEFEKYWVDNGLALGSKGDAEHAYKAAWQTAIELVIKKLEARHG